MLSARPSGTGLITCCSFRGMASAGIPSLRNTCPTAFGTARTRMGGVSLGVFRRMNRVAVRDDVISRGANGTCTGRSGVRLLALGMGAINTNRLTLAKLSFSLGNAAGLASVTAVGICCTNSGTRVASRSLAVGCRTLHPNANGLRLHSKSGTNGRPLDMKGGFFVMTVQLGPATASKGGLSKRVAGLCFDGKGSMIPRSSSPSNSVAVHRVGGLSTTTCARGYASCGGGVMFN